MSLIRRLGGGGGIEEEEKDGGGGSQRKDKREDDGELKNKKRLHIPFSIFNLLPRPVVLHQTQLV